MDKGFPDTHVARLNVCTLTRLNIKINTKDPKDTKEIILCTKLSEPPKNTAAIGLVVAR